MTSHLYLHHGSDGSTIPPDRVGPETVIDSELVDDIFRVHVTGPTSFRRTEDFVLAHMDLLEKHSVIWDMRDAVHGEDTYQSIREFLRRNRAIAERRRGKRSAVICGNTYQFGLVRMVEESCILHDHPFLIRAFRSMDEAEDWVRNGS